MAEDRTIILKVELDVDQLKKAQKEAAAAINGLTAERKELRGATEKDNVAIAENALALKKANKTLKDSTAALATNEEARKNNTGSLTQMRQQLAAAKVAFNDLSQAQRESDFGQKAANDMLALKNQINETEQSFGTFTGSVGNYVEANEEVVDVLKQVQSGLLDVEDGILSIEKEMQDLTNAGKGNSKEFKELEKTYESVREEQKILAGDMEHLGKDILVEVSTSISKMEDRMFELRLENKQNTDEYKTLEAQTVKYKKAVIEVDQSIDQLVESGKGISSALALSETVVAGYQAYASITAIVGTENEEFLKVLTKIQAAQGLLNSIQLIQTKLQQNAVKITRLQAGAQNLLNLAIGNGTKASKLFRSALLLTGVGALVIGVVLLVKNFDKLKASFSGVSKQQQILTDVTEQAIEAIAEEASAADKLQKTLEDESISREEKLEAVLELQKEYPSLLANIDAENDSIEDINKALSINIQLLTLRAQAEAVAEVRAEEFKNIIKAQTDAQTGANKGVLAWSVGLTSAKNAQIAHTFAQADAIKKSKQQVDALDAIDKGLQDQIKTLLANGAVGESEAKTAKAIEDQAENDRKQRASAAKKRAADALATAERIRKLTLGNIQLSLEEERKLFEAHFEFLEISSSDNAEELILIEEDKNTKLADLESRERQARIDATNSDFEKLKEAAKKSTEELALIAEEQRLTIASINSDFDLLAEKRDVESIARVKKLNAEKVKQEKDTANKIALIDKELALTKAEGTEQEAAAFAALQAEKIRQIELVRDAEIAAANKTAAEKELINKEAEAAILAVKKEHLADAKEADELSVEEKKQLAITVVNAAQSLANSLLQIAQNQLTEELNSEIDQNESQNELLNSQLAAGLISQAEFDAQKSALDAQFAAKESAIKKKQFEREKAASIVNAVIATAVSVAQALPNPILAAIAGALGAAQVALIVAQPTPKFARGGSMDKEGMLKGASHSGGGVQLSANGVPIGEAEGGERFFILNKRASKTISGLDQLNQKYGGVPLAARGAVMKFQGGGGFAAEVSRPADNRLASSNQIAAAASQAPIVVKVQDILSGTERLVSVMSSSEF